MGFNQDNKHHVMDLFNHLLATSMNVAAKSDDNNLITAGSLHDIGKLSTKTYTKGDKNAHYYGHQCVSAYDSMFILKQKEYNDEKILNICQYVSWHMYPYQIKLEKTRNKFIKFVGQEFYDNLMVLHEADEEAH